MNKKIPQLLLTCFLSVSLAACGGDKKSAPVAAEEEEGHHEEETSLVSLTEEQIRTVGITLGSIEQKALAASIKVAGTLAVPAQNKASVTSLYGGVLQSLRVHPGTYVRKGQVIGTVTNAEVTTIQQQLISVNAQLRLAQLEHDRQRQLVAGNAAPLKNVQRAQADLSSLRAQQSALRQQLSMLGISSSSVSNGNISSTLTITAPISGTIGEIHAQIGSEVSASTPVATIINNSELHLDLFVYEKDLPHIRNGQIIHFTLTNNPGREYDAKIFSVGTAFADASKAVAVHAEVEGDKTGLIEGMAVTANVSTSTSTVPTVPDEAIVSAGGKDYIFIQTNKKAEAHAEEEEEGHEHEEGEDEHKSEEPGGEAVTFERVQIVRGTSDLGYTEIKPVEPLPANVRVVVKGAFFVMAKMTNTGGHEH